MNVQLASSNRLIGLEQCLCNIISLILDLTLPIPCIRITLLLLIHFVILYCTAYLFSVHVIEPFRLVDTEEKDKPPQ